MKKGTMRALALVLAMALMVNATPVYAMEQMPVVNEPVVEEAPEVADEQSQETGEDIHQTEDETAKDEADLTEDEAAKDEADRNADDSGDAALQSEQSLEETISADVDATVESGEQTEDIYFGDKLFQNGAISVVDEDTQEMLAADGTIESDAATSNAEKAKQYIYEQLLKGNLTIDITAYDIRITRSSTSVRFNASEYFSGVVNEHPDLYFVTGAGSYSYQPISDNEIKLTKLTFTATGGTYDKKAFDDAVEQALSVIEPEMTNLEKAIALHDYLALNCAYDYQNYLNGTIPKDSYTAYGILVKKTGVCQGYALAYKYLLDKIGIFAYMVTSDAMNHAWNLIVLDGKCYQVDVTWDDPTWDKIGNCYHSNMFLSDDAFISKTKHHDWVVTKGGVDVAIKATDTTYDNAFWGDIKSALLRYDGYYYYSKYDGSSTPKRVVINRQPIDSIALNESTIYNNVGIWNVWGSTSYWTGSYCYPYERNGRIFFNTKDSVCSVKFDGTDAKKEYNIDTSTGYIYGFLIQGNIMSYVLLTTPNTKGPYKVYTSTLSPTVSKPAFSVPTGTILKGSEVAITAEEGATIRYTLDGTKPEETTGTVYTAPITITEDTTIKAIAVKGDLVSSVATAIYRVAVNQFKLAKDKIVMDKDGTDQITIEALPTGRTNADVTFTSSDTGVVTVDDTGKIKGIKLGTATITAKVKGIDDKDVTATCEVVVKGYTHIFKDDQGNVIDEKQTEKKETLLPPQREGYKIEGEVQTSYDEETRTYTYIVKYVAIVYSITYENAHDNGSNPTTYTVETETITLADAKWAYHTFGGWYKNATYSGNKVTEIKKGSTGDLVLYAKFEAEKMEVPVCVPNGGKIDSDTPISLSSVNEGADIYYTTDGKVPTESTGTKYTEPFTLAKNATVKAIAVREGESSKIAEYKFEVCSLVFELEKTEISIENGKKQMLNIKTYPTGSENKKVTWSTDDAAVVQVTQAGEIEAKAVGKAVITAKTVDYKDREVTATCTVTVTKTNYTVIFRDYLGRQIGEAQRVEEGTDATPPTVPDRKGYLFAKWDGDYTNVQSNIVLTAQYKAIVYTITYDLDGGVIADNVNPTEYTIESETIHLQEPTRDARVFIGWYDGSTPVTEIRKGSAGNLVLTAKWEENKTLLIREIQDQQYTGVALKPSVVVYYGSSRLQEGTDYSVAYKNNVNANDLSSAALVNKAPTVTVQGKGNYAGKATKTFKILQQDFSETAMADTITMAYKANKYQKPVPVVMLGSKKLVANKDYRLVAKDGSVEKTMSGTYMYDIVGQGNYCGSIPFKYVIAESTQKLMSTAKVTLVSPQFNNAPIEITDSMIQVKIGTQQLVLDEDYVIENNCFDKAGTYNIVLRAAEFSEKYVGSKTVKFVVKGTSIAGIKAIFKESSVYDGTCKLPKPVITLKGNTLKEGIDYETIVPADYTNNVNAGTAKLTIKGMGAYFGTKTVTFAIAKQNASALEVTFANGSDQQEYAKGAVKPEVIVTYCGQKLTLGTDYAVAYAGNTAINSQGMVKITGKKNFVGLKSVYFTVVAKDLNHVPFAYCPAIEEGKKPVPVLFDDNGKQLKEKADYTIAQGEGNQLILTGANNYTGSLTLTYDIVDKSINLGKAKVAVTRGTVFYYTGKQVIPDKDQLTVTLNGEEVTDYEIIAVPGNPLKGTAKFYIKGVNGYSGMKAFSVNIKSRTLL